ncbi:MAG: Ig-like domain-containing protein [Oligoflexia bacterium]|nr:Ig-like domain-containing protein [Oligoflexia bacterium]
MSVLTKTIIFFSTIFILLSGCNPTSTTQNKANSLENSSNTNTALIVNPSPTPSNTQSTLSSYPKSIDINSNKSSTVTINLKDAKGKAIVGKSIAIYSNRGSFDIITPTYTSTDSFGRATFNVTSSIPGLATISLIDYQTKRILTDQTSDISFSSNAVSTIYSSVQFSPSMVLDNKIDYSTITVTLKDSNNVSVNGKSIYLSSDRGDSDSFFPLQSVTNINGQATFTVKSNVDGISNISVYDIEGNGVLLSNIATIIFVDTVSEQSSITAVPSSLWADNYNTSTVTVTLKNPIGVGIYLSDKTISLISSRASLDTITPSSATTNNFGQATFTIKSQDSGTSILTVKNSNTGVIYPNFSTSITFTIPNVDFVSSNINSSKSYSDDALSNGTDYFTSTVTLKTLNTSFIKGKSIKLSSNPSAGVTINPNMSTTNTSGSASFTISSTVAGTKTLSVVDSISGSPITSPTLEGTILFAAPTMKATNSSISASSPILANNIDKSTVTVTVKDTRGTNISGKSVSLTTSLGTPTPGSVTTGSDGVATFYILSSTPGQSYPTASADGVNLTTTPITFTTLPVEPTCSYVNVNPSSILASGTPTSTVTVTLKNSLLALMPDQTVSVSSSRGSTYDIIAPLTATTNASGVATFYIQSTTVGNATLTAQTSNNLSISRSTTTNTVAFTLPPTDAINSDVSANPENLVANGTSASTVTVTVKNILGNVLENKDVSLSSAPAIATIIPGTATTDSSGHALFSVTSSTPTTYTLSANVITDSNTAITDTASVTFVYGRYCPVPTTLSEAGQKCIVSNQMYTFLKNANYLHELTVSTPAYSAPSSFISPPHHMLASSSNSEDNVNVNVNVKNSDMVVINKYLKKYPHTNKRVTHLISKILENDKRLNIKSNNLKNNNDKKFSSKILPLPPRKLMDSKYAIKEIRRSLEAMESRKDKVNLYKLLRNSWSDKSSSSYYSSYTSSPFILSDSEVANLSLSEIESLNQKLSTTIAEEYLNQDPSSIHSKRKTGSKAGGGPLGTSCDFNSTHLYPAKMHCLYDAQPQATGAAHGYDLIPGSSNGKEEGDQSLVSHCSFTLKDYLTCVKDQAARGACVAFSLVAAVEAKLFYSTGNNYNLSEQALYHIMKSKWEDASDYPANIPVTDGYVLTDAVEYASGTPFAIPLESQWEYNPSYCIDVLSQASSSYSGYNACSFTAKPGYSKTTQDGYCRSPYIGSDRLGAYYKQYCSPSPSQGLYVCNTNSVNCGYMTYAENTTSGATITSKTTLAFPGNESDMNTNINTVDTALIAGNPVVGAIQLTEDPDNIKSKFMNTINGLVIDPTPDDYLAGSHAILFVAFIPCAQLATKTSVFTRCSAANIAADGLVGGAPRGYFILKNSYSNYSGDAGFYYISDLYIREYMQSFSIIAGATYNP